MKKFKKTIPYILAVCACTALPAFIGCTVPGEVIEFDTVTEIANGGFETGNLSGFTVEYGDAFDDDSVSSESEFYFSYDAEHKMIPIGKTGNWFLSGKGYDGNRPHGYTGSIRSGVFTLGGDGTISMKLAGGALVTQKGENAPQKSPEKTCYVGVYRASDDLMIAKFTNKYFLEHTEPYVNVNDYINGTCCTDNFYKYSEDLSDFYGQELYIRIVDNDVHNYYGYISVDDICIGGASSQPDGALFAKTRDFTETAEKPSIYEIANGGFETGSLAGWTVVSGEAFSNEGVNNAKYWWNENIPYKRDGDYHYGYYKPTTVGVMRSSDFVVGGSGYVTYKLGGCSNNSATYLRFMIKNPNGDDYEAARFSNFKFWNYQFPYVQNGMRLLNLVQYYADFSSYMGQTMYIEVVDENASADELGCITLDSVVTYYEQKPEFYTSIAFEALPDPDRFDIEPDNEFQVKNGTFETGDLTGWTMLGDIGDVSNATGWWNENLPYNKKGEYLFTGIDKEAGTGTLMSAPFTLGGSGDVTFRLGGGGNPAKCYVSILDAETDEELARFANLNFRDNGIESINRDSYLANMVSYHANLVELGIQPGTRLKIRITDNATNNWGLITADSFITYYESSSAVPKGCVTARNIKPTPLEDSEYQIANGDFETGSLGGWTVVDGNINVDAAVTTGDTFWDEGIPYNNGGLFHFDGWKATDDEAATYALRSENFTLGGSGFISFKMGGRTAQVKVYKVGVTDPIAVFDNTAFADVEFPHVDKGCRLATMMTFVADLTAYAAIGDTLYIELCDKPSETDSSGNPLNWGVAFFDDVITYYETAPAVEEKSDTVTLNAVTSGNGVTEYNIPWVTAVNALSEDQK